ncbi:uncharacterized protein F5Z01DRAFT_640039 [Emericellopsis atlantica]|uniref:Uncharacterized protein n=1 Tax=Emericellopsis atlantica TaxID=2614577 RepID=A0A9P8CKR7_9HYPO|nr:uncharacterized protein F5Z01DRAFT_640039 [Emericellopsis atlantica]KAG9250633.1 hypothetical protein F5Z01DRAFT_640039 [Emericellopsis atlantica]
MSSFFPDCFQPRLYQFYAQASLQGASQHHSSSCHVFKIDHKTGASLKLKATRGEVRCPELLVSEYNEKSRDHTIRTEPWVVEDVPADEVENYIQSIGDNMDYFEAFVSEYGTESINELLLSIRQAAWEGSIAWQALEAFVAYSLATSVSYTGEDEHTPRLIENQLQLALAKAWKDRWCSARSTKGMISTSDKDASTVVLVLLTERVLYDFKYRGNPKAARRSVEFGKRLVSQLSEDLRSHEWSLSCKSPKRPLVPCAYRSIVEKSPLGVPIGKRIFDPQDVDCLVGSLLSLAKRKDTFFQKL